MLALLLRDSLKAPEGFSEVKPKLQNRGDAIPKFSSIPMCDSWMGVPNCLLGSDCSSPVAPLPNEASYKYPYLADAWPGLELPQSERGD